MPLTIRTIIDFYFISLFLLVFLLWSATAVAMNTPGIKFVSYNCRSVKNSVKDINELCKNHDVVILQETWLLPHDIAFLNAINHDFLSFGISAVDTSGVFL